MDTTTPMATPAAAIIMTMPGMTTPLMPTMTTMPTSMMTMGTSTMIMPPTITRRTITQRMDTGIITNMTDPAGASPPPSEAGGPQTSLPLFIWLSPAFPVGAFAYSHGLEAAVEAGDIADATSLAAWIDDLVRFGSLRGDALLMAEAWRAAQASDLSALVEINELALALAPSRERHLETSAQGNAFVMALRASWPHPLLDALAGAAENIAYPVGVGVAAAAHGIALATTLDAFLVAFTGNLVSACVRLGPVGQTDGQRVIAGLVPALRDLAGFALHNGLDALGSIALRSDIAAMRHETQYSRLFRS